MDRKDAFLHADALRYDGVLKVRELTFDAPRFDGPLMRAIAREIVVRVDAAAALVHDTQRDVVILCEQFRAAVYQAGGAWLVEFPAGKIDGDESPESCIRRELEEEIGYRAQSVHPIGSYFTAPGYSTERVHLFYAPVASGSLINAKAHGVDEGEDVRRVEMDRPMFLKRLAAGDFADGKILAAGAWALTNLS